ncbi:IS630 family transposase [Streptomyces sp. NPDC051636]|uniref:IS630 family transposase n=1 Tax=Streptomyces sp. NPDC051636 TaxID=3365663 RepID=UPI0037A6D7AD
MTPPTARTWARRGRTPVIRVRGRSQRRFLIAALACFKQGERSRLIHRPKRHLGHKRGGRRSFTWTDYRDLLIAAHQQLGAPIVLVWDNLNVHKDRRLREFSAPVVADDAQPGLLAHRCQRLQRQGHRPARCPNRRSRDGLRHTTAGRSLKVYASVRGEEAGL